MLYKKVNYDSGLQVGFDSELGSHELNLTRIESVEEVIQCHQQGIDMFLKVIESDFEDLTNEVDAWKKHPATRRRKEYFSGYRCVSLKDLIIAGGNHLMAPAIYGEIDLR